MRQCSSLLSVARTGCLRVDNLQRKYVYLAPDSGGQKSKTGWVPWQGPHIASGHGGSVEGQ